jgi:glycine/D-amino acid oxidase-like deaminating enzyme
MTKIARRNMLRTIGGISLAGLVPLNGAASNVTNNSVKKIETDILVVGGGTAGVIAAIQAARAGCSTILVENGSQLGGTTTTGGVAFPGLFHAWGKQIVGGIGWELVKEVVRLDDGVLPDFSIPTGKQHWKHQVRLNGYLYSLLAEEKCLEAGVQIRYYETPVKAAFKQGNWHVETVGKGTHTLIKCNQLIDCTGNASVTSLAGFNVLRGQEIQPGTLMFKIGGYDPEKLDFNLLETKYNQAVDRKELARVEFRNIDVTNFSFIGSQF